MSDQNNDNTHPLVLLKKSLSKHGSLGNQEVLPLNILNKGKNILENEDIEFLGQVENDELFLYVKLPEGWRIECTELSFFSILYDNNNKKRALIFYSSGTLSRSAFLHVYECQED